MSPYYFEKVSGAWRLSPEVDPAIKGVTSVTLSERQALQTVGVCLS